MREPNLFLVGAPKSGTTALYAMLAAHPEVFMCTPKEPDFFAADVIAAARPKSAITDWPSYLSCFAPAGDVRVVGEGSVSYLASHSAAAAIATRLPHARIVMVLRDPAERLFSHYKAARAARQTLASFSAWVADAVTRERALAPVGPITPGRYASHLTKFLREFPARQIHVIWHEEFVSDPGATLQHLFAFLDVDAQCAMATHQRRNETHELRLAVSPRLRPVLTALVPPRLRRRVRQWTHAPSKATMTSGERRAAAGVYLEEIVQLAAMTGRRLDHWLPEQA